MPSATRRMTKIKIRVPRTAPAILFPSKESMWALISPEPTKRPANKGGHYPPVPANHCGEASQKIQPIAGFSRKQGLNTGPGTAHESDPVDTRPHGFGSPAGKAAGRHCRLPHDRAGLAAGDGGKTRPGGGGGGGAGNHPDRRISGRTGG